MKIALFPIGIESSTGGWFSPILDDNRFKYIPIPQDEFSTQNPNYKKLISKLNKFHKEVLKCSYDLKPYSEIPSEPWQEFPQRKYLGDYLSDRMYKGYPLKSYIPHFDPEFKTFTYGEGSKVKANTLVSLTEGDILVFYMSLIHAFHNKPKGKFLIGYFTIEEIFDYRFRNISIDYRSIDERIKNNMHIIRKDPKPVIALGKLKESRLFKHAFQFTDNINWNIFPEICQKIEWDKKTTKLYRGTRILKDTAAEKFRDLIINHDI